MIRVLLVIVFYCLCCAHMQAQQIAEQHLEGRDDPEDSGDMEEVFDALEQFRKHPLNLNQADGTMLKELYLLSELQVASFLNYRKLLGPLVSVYELQAVPDWDLLTIRKLLPYITVKETVSSIEKITKRFRKGEQQILFRCSQVMEPAVGYKLSADDNGFLGKNQNLLFRYRYNYKNLLKYGLIAEKDAGESLFKRSQRVGFDFYSFHFSLKNIGIVQSVVIGDFTVSMGQGLIQWQGMALGKTANISMIKRAAPVLKPYSSTGEFYFLRGAGVTIRKRKIETTIFGSVRKLSANMFRDTILATEFVSSFISSGYHRNHSENNDRNKLIQTSFGLQTSFNRSGFHFGLNSIYHGFSHPLRKRNEPYNLYAISGTNWYNISVDYSMTLSNMHMFGEIATDKNRRIGILNGMLLSVDPKVDLSFLQRILPPKYQSLNGSAFTENTFPSNETGFFTGICIRPSSLWKIEAFLDMYYFPWLKNVLDVPSKGSDLMAQITIIPVKHTEILTKFRFSSRPANKPEIFVNSVTSIPKQQWRLQVNSKINPQFELRNRVELIWYNKKSSQAQTGFISYFDVLYKPLRKPYSVIGRLGYFETTDYSARIYAYENDILYNYSIPALSGVGVRYYILTSFEPGKLFSFWIRWAQAIYKHTTSLGSGLDEIPGNKKSELKFQVRMQF